MPVTKGQRVFTAGHSFHFWVPSILDEMAQSSGLVDHQIAGVSAIGGSTVSMHWDVPDPGNPIRNALIAGQVDVLTLSPIWLPDPGIENFTMLGLQHKANLRLTVQEYWLPNDAYEPELGLNTSKVVDHNAATAQQLHACHALYFRDMDNYIAAINQKAGKNAVLIVPAGQAVLGLREKIIAGQAPGVKTQAELFSDSWGHPTEVIQALAAYCHFAVIYRRSPVGLPEPKILIESKIPPQDLAPLNLLLQQLAWDAVIHHPMSGVTGNPSTSNRPRS